MSTDIRKLLDIQDGNIAFKENSVSYEQYKGVTCKFVKAVLTYEPSRCLKRDSKKVGVSILKKWNTNINRIILHLSFRAVDHTIQNKSGSKVA